MIFSAVGISMTIDTAAIRERAEDATPGPWRCFHCHAVFTEWQAAMHHFGVYANAMAACLFTGEEQILRTLRAEEHSAQEMFRQKTEYEHEISHLRAELAAKDALLVDRDNKVALAYVVTELTDKSCPPKLPGASWRQVLEVANRILSTPENHWQRALRTNAFACVETLAKLKEQE